MANRTIARRTVYGFAKHCMQDDEFQRGGIPTGETDWLKSIGMEFTVHEDGVIEIGEDASRFYTAMATLYELDRKYSRKDGRYDD